MAENATKKPRRKNQATSQSPSYEQGVRDQAAKMRAAAKARAASGEGLRTPASDAPQVRAQAMPGTQAARVEAAIQRTAAPVTPSYEQGVRERAAVMREAAQKRVAAGDGLRAPASAAPSGIAQPMPTSQAAGFSTNPAPVVAPTPAPAATPTAAAPAATPAAPAAQKGFLGRATDSLRGGASATASAVKAPFSAAKILTKASVPAVIGAGVAKVADMTPKTKDTTPSVPAAGGIPTAIGASPNVAQIPTAEPYAAPAKVEDRSPLGIGPNNEFTRNVANALNSLPGGRSLSTFLRGGSTAAAAVRGAETATQGVRGAQMYNTTKDDPAAAAATTAAAPAGPKLFDPKNPLAYDDSNDFPMAPASTGFSKQAEGMRSYLAGEQNARGKLPQDLSMLQKGVVYKTMDKNGNPVYSGVNVGENANIVNERGIQTGQLSGLETYAAGTTPGITADGKGFAYIPGASPQAGAGAAAPQGQGAPAAQAQGVRQPPAAQMSSAMGAQVSDALRAAADRGDWDAVRNYYQSQNGGQGMFMGRTAAQDAAAAPSGPTLMPAIGSSYARDLERKNLRTGLSSITGGNPADAMRLAAMDREDLEAMRQQGENQRLGMQQGGEDRRLRMQLDASTKAAGAKAQGDAMKAMLDQFNKDREFNRNVSNDRFAQQGQNAERDRNRRSDIDKSLGTSFQVPEMKDGKPTGKFTEDTAALGRFKEEVVARLGKDRAEQLTGEEWVALARQFKPTEGAISRMNAGTSINDPTLRQLPTRQMEWGDVLKKGDIGVLDVANARLNPFSKGLDTRTVLDSTYGTAKRAAGVFAPGGQTDMRALEELDPAYALQLQLERRGVRR